MGVYIAITKVFEKEDIGFYHVFTEDYGGAEFYVGFDKKFYKIYCFLTNNFSHPIRIIDLNNPNERIGELPGIRVSATILGRIFMTARKAFEFNEFPQYLDYAA